MSEGLFYTCRNVTSSFSKGLLCNIKILEQQHDNIDFLTFKETEHSKNFIENYLKINIRKNLNLYGQAYENYIKQNVNSWKEIYDDIDVSHLKRYDDLYIMGGLHFPQSEITRISKLKNEFPNTNVALRFRQNAAHIINVLAIHKAHVLYDIPLHEFCYDSDELATELFQVKQNSKKYNAYHIYDMPRINLKRLDSLQYYYQKMALSNSEIINILYPRKKEYDLVFGYTVYNYGNRPNYVDWVNKMLSKFEKTQLYVKNKITDENNVVDKDFYLDRISSSKYTLIIPSYDPMCFSLYRFIEALQHDCLPIIHSDCKLSEVEKSFDVDISPLLETEFNRKISETERIDLLKHYQNKFLTFERGFIK